MKVKKMLAMFAVSFILCFSTLSVSSAAEYLGQFCWLSPDGEATLMLGITHMGDGHFLVHGKITESTGAVLAVNGNAEIVGNEAIMHISSSGSIANDFWVTQDRLILDLQTGNGISLEQLCHHVDKFTGEITQSYEAVTEILPLIPCD